MIDFDGVIFDLDGTIADSHYVWKKVDSDFFGKRGRDIPSDYSQEVGSMSFKDAAVFTKNKYGFSETVDEIMEEWYSMAVNEYTFNVQAKPFAKEYIEYLKNRGVKIALCTASPRELFEPFLKNNQIFSYFDVFVSGTEVSRGKEFPDIYLLAARKLSVLPERCIVFEDILKAVFGARAAGMKIIGVFESVISQEERIKIREEADGFIYDFSMESLEKTGENLI